MYVIKIKNRDLFYNNRNSHGFHDSLDKADCYNTEKGAKNALNTLKYWWEQGCENSSFRREYHSYIKNFKEDVEIRKVKITLI